MPNWCTNSVAIIPNPDSENREGFERLKAVLREHDFEPEFFSPVPAGLVIDGIWYSNHWGSYMIDYDATVTIQD